MFGLGLNLATLKARLALGAAIISAVALLCAIFFFFGKREGKTEVEAGAATSAVSRIQNMDKNNETFRSMPGRDRCLLLARDSRLPDSTCDQR